MGGSSSGTGRTRLFTGLLVCGLYGLLEAGSAIVLSLTSGELFSLAGARAERAAVLRHTERVTNRAVEDQRDQVAGPSSGVDSLKLPPEVLHPFLGYVRDPTSSINGELLNSFGFYEPRAPADAESDPLTIGVFGGSVAAGLAASPKLAEELRKSPQFRDREIWVRSFALGGYKQPQQLIALNYVLALGQRFDVVVNLDGFNDIALAPRDYQASRLFPFYPRRWNLRVADVPNVKSQRLIGEIAYREALRDARTRWFSKPLRSWSPTLHLVWKVIDLQSSRRLSELRSLFAEQKGARQPYVSHGPKRAPTSDLDLLSELADVWARSSRQMHELCAGLGIRYYHFLQPNQYLPGSKRLTLAEKQGAFDGDHPWAASVAQGYPLLLRAGHELESEGLEFHDLSMVFGETESTLYVDTCCHFNAEGMQLVAEAVAASILAPATRD